MKHVASATLILLLAACGSRPQPIVYEPLEPAPGESTSATPAATTADSKPTTANDRITTPARDFTVPTLPMSLVLYHRTLVWADAAGALWTMPANGSTAPKQVSEQHHDGLATHPFIAGDHVFAKGGKDLLALAVPDGPVTRVHVTGTSEIVEEVVGDSTTLFVTVFQHDQILKVSITGGAAQHVLDIKNAIMALHGKNLYAVSYLTGELIAIPLGGGAPRKIASKLDHTTALVVDDKAAYVYTEGNRRVSRIDLATGASTTLAENLNNSDELDLAGDMLYTVSWPDKLVAVPTVAGSATRTLAEGLFQPRGVAHDDAWVYVTTDKSPRIVRVPRK